MHDKSILYTSENVKDVTSHAKKNYVDNYWSIFKNIFTGKRNVNVLNYFLKCRNQVKMKMLTSIN